MLPALHRSEFFCLKQLSWIQKAADVPLPLLPAPADHYQQLNICSAVNDGLKKPAGIVGE